MYNLTISIKGKTEPLYFEVSADENKLKDIMTHYLDDTSMCKSIRQQFQTEYVCFCLKKLDEVEGKYEPILYYEDFL